VLLAPAAAALALIAWTIAGLALVRGAERRVLRRVPPKPWRAAAFALGAAVCAVVFRATPVGAVACGATCIALIVAGEADARTGYLFDAITFPTALLVTAIAVAGGTTLDAACGVCVLVGSFGALVVCSRGRLMGLGDVKAMFAIGAAFGPLESIVAIFAACVSGIVWTAFAGRLRCGAQVHFGPHLAAGSAFALVGGDFVVHRMLGL
jgi:prepilin signal peptidase PulO-like enzyme (type II secretory pathway)